MDIMSVQQHSTGRNQSNGMRTSALLELSSLPQGQESTHFPWPQRMLQRYGRPCSVTEVRVLRTGAFLSILSHVDTHDGSVQFNQGERAVMLRQHPHKRSICMIKVKHHRLDGDRAQRGRVRGCERGWPWERVVVFVRLEQKTHP